MEMAMAMVEGDGDDGQNRVSGGISGYGGGRQPETVRADNNQQNAAAILAETAVVAGVIVAAWL